MSQPAPQGGELEALVWSSTADELHLREPDWRQALAAQGLQPWDVLRDLSDESLAVAIQKGLWTDDAFQELFGVRGKEYLAGWFQRWRVEFHLAQDLTQ